MQERTEEQLQTDILKKNHSKLEQKNKVKSVNIIT